MIATNDNGYCFVCGEKNPLGLHIQFHSHHQADGVEATVLFPLHFQGWEGIVHGGLISTVLDEIMVKAAAGLGFKCITAELTVTFRKPVRTETEYSLFGKILQERGKILLAESQLLGKEAECLAKASGKLFKTA